MGLPEAPRFVSGGFGTSCIIVPLNYPLCSFGARLLLSIYFCLTGMARAQVPCEGEDEFGTPFAVRAEAGAGSWDLHSPSLDDTTLAVLDTYNRRIWQNVPCLAFPRALIDSIRAIAAVAEADLHLLAVEDSLLRGQVHANVYWNLVEAARASPADPVAVVVPLLESADPADHVLGLGLARGESAVADPEVRTALLRLLRSPGGDARERLRVIALFNSHSDKTVVAVDARALADTTSEPEIQWAAAGQVANPVGW